MSRDNLPDFMKRQKRKFVAQVDFPGGGGFVDWLNVTNKPSTFPPDTHTHPNVVASGASGFMTGADKTKLDGVSGSNTGDQTSIVGITGTKAQFDTAVTDGNFLYVGDVTSNATHTGDATGSTALTLATVNGNVGSFGLAGSVAQFVVNAKGLITSAVNVAISITSAAISDFTSAVNTLIGAASINALSDVTITAPSTGQILKWNGSQWVNDTDATGGGGGSSNTGQAVLDFGTYGEDATVDVTGQASIIAGSRIFVSIAAVDTAENTIDDVFADPPQILVGNITPSTGFTVYGRALEGGLHGRINVNWNWI